MITSNEIKRKAENKFTAYLKSLIAGKTLFPLLIPSSKTFLLDNFKSSSAEINDLYKNSKQARGFGYTVETEQVNTQRYGMQTKVKKIFFETETDFIRFIKKENEVRIFKTNGAQIKNECLRLNRADIQSSFCLKHLSAVRAEQEPDYWKNIFSAAEWFVQNPHSQLFLREIPLNVHTKFIEGNWQRIFSVYCLIKKIPQPVVYEKNVYTIWQVKKSPALIRFRVSDSALHVSFAGETIFTNDIRIPISDFAQLQFQNIEHIFVIENKMIYLTFPKVPKSIYIFGSGYAARILKQNKSLATKKIIYFGDLDEHGFEILSDVRKIFPHTISFCMDMQCYRSFSEFAVKGKSSKRAIESLELNDDEKELFLFLKQNPEANRLEQERITQRYIKAKLKERLLKA